MLSGKYTEIPELLSFNLREHIVAILVSICLLAIALPTMEQHVTSTNPRSIAIAIGIGLIVLWQCYIIAKFFLVPIFLSLAGYLEMSNSIKCRNSNGNNNVNNSQNNPQAMPCKDKNTHSTNKKKNYGNPIDLILLGYNFFVFLFVHVFSSLAGTYILCLRGSINSEPTVVNVNRGEPMTEHKRPLIYRFKLRIMRGLLDVLAKIGLIPS